MKLLVDAQVPGAEACFGPLGQLVRMPGRAIDAEALRDIDGLVIRSITRLDAATIDTAKAQGSPLRFVGTCTIGTDHVDQLALARHGIAFASAPGCNAEAVTDYVLGSLLCLAERQGWRLAERRIGIVGVGNVGRRIQQRLSAMGVSTFACDPPRAETEGAGGFHDLESLIEACDVICLHTPLVREGRHATRHLMDAERIARLSPGTVLLNAGRGDCIDSAALKRRLTQSADISAILDVWEHEPGIDCALHALVDIATPHIAGHSLDGKLRGTYQIYRALANHLQRPVDLDMQALLPPPPLRQLTLGQGLNREEVLRLCVRGVHDVRRDHDSLRRESYRFGMAKGFDMCRADYPLRREFSSLSVNCPAGETELAAWLHGAGFQQVSEARVDG